MNGSNSMDNINKYITIPMAVKVMEDDKKAFDEFYYRYIYQDLIDSTIERMENDFRKLQPKLYNAVRRINATTYAVNDSTIEYTPTELKELTAKTMQEYMRGPVESKEHVNPFKGFPPQLLSETKELLNND